MEFYNQPVKNTYLTDRTKWFEMPMSDGTSKTVITVTTGESTYWVIAYTIIISSIFVAVAHLVTGFILTYFPLGHKGNRHVMLVSFYNSDSPYAVIANMYNYICRALANSRRNGEWAVNWDTFLTALLLAIVAGSIIVASLATRFLVGGSNNLIVRYAARANPDAIFYPAVPPGSQAFEALMPVRAPAAYQALGRVAAAQANVQKVVKISSASSFDDAKRPTFELNYSYSLSGADMGLQLSPNLAYTVDGKCRTEYSWLNTTRLKDLDLYPLWGRTDRAFVAVASVDGEWDNPVWVLNFARPDELNRSIANHGFEFALIPNASHRKSNTNNTIDPWYFTEPNPDYVNANATTKPQFNPFQVQRGRPPLHCWQNDTWAIGNAKVFHVTQLANLTGLRLSSFFRDIVFQREFTAPPVTQLVNNLGYAMLASSLTTIANTKVINANLCNITKDIERLIQISYVSSREVVRNTALAYSSSLNQGTFQNRAAGPDGKVPYESADFILESKDVAALSVATLITVPCICAFFWLLVWLRSIGHGGTMTSNTGSVSRHNMRAVALQATQLYRYLDEQISGKIKWSGRTGMAPYIKEIEGNPERGTGDADPLLPISVAGPNRQGLSGEEIRTAEYIRPKIFEIPNSDSEDPEKNLSLLQRMVFWKPHDPPDYELVMARTWHPGPSSS